MTELHSQPHADDVIHMAHALRMGERGLGQVWPNPAVGCVIVKDGRILGRGWTQIGGRPHAETVALAQAGEAARGATAYVTLEPCAHYGHTPPCALGLINAGVARVVSAMTDPDPRVAGRGHAMLRAAGIAVCEGVLGAEARRANAGFLKRVEQGLPFVTLKLATTLDGRIAMASGESRWITGPEARRKVHALRMSHDAVLVGSGTALADDPDLQVRELGATRQPLRLLIDSGLRHRADSRLGRSASAAAPVWILHGEGAETGTWAQTEARLLAEPLIGGRLDLRAALSRLAAEGVTRVFCEGGAGLASALLQAGLVDELIAFSAGRLFGAQAVAAIAPLGIERLADTPRFTLLESAVLGADVMTRWRTGA